MKTGANRVWTVIVVTLTAAITVHFLCGYFDRNRVLKEIIARLSADSRVAEAMVIGVNYDKSAGKKCTTIKFLEYDTSGKPLEPKYFTFSDNLIQFQTLVVRFQDVFVENGDKLRGKSAYLFWKVFVLDGKNTEEYKITDPREIPEGYRVDKKGGAFERQIWGKFWNIALEEKLAKRYGVKNAQVEAPGVRFVPGFLYTLKIEHDGGLRIDASPIPEIFNGESGKQ
ncbi:MAG: hypothetical protein HQL28_02110 [Candidatus Omnitrophica bacterium]|nr:hypothetical protein [Candidatus Omnitrophota bacterium]